MEQGPPPPEHSRLLVGGALDGAAQALARERQKQEIRRERDHIVLAIARELGTEELAARLGTSADVTETLLARARERLVTGRPDEHRAIVARRRGPDRERWSEADRDYEYLGRRAWLPGWSAPRPRRGG